MLYYTGLQEKQSPSGTQTDQITFQLPLQPRWTIMTNQKHIPRVEIGNWSCSKWAWRIPWAAANSRFQSSRDRSSRSHSKPPPRSAAVKTLPPGCLWLCKLVLSEGSVVVLAAALHSLSPARFPVWCSKFLSSTFFLYLNWSQWFTNRNAECFDADTSII